jgi:hypothetical protein
LLRYSLFYQPIDLGKLTSDQLVDQLDKPNDWYARTARRLLADRRDDLAGSEKSPVVRMQLACSARRLPAGQDLPIVEKLLGHSEDVQDRYIPLLLWWAIQDKAIDGRLLDARQPKEVRIAAVAALQQFDDPGVPAAALEKYPA